MRRKRNVVFLQRMLPDYRAPLFPLLHQKLARHKIDFRLVYGQMTEGDGLREGELKGEWVRKVRNVYLAGNIHYPIIGSSLNGADLIIVHQENAHLINYVLLAKRYLFKGPMIAYFGHGRNLRVVGTPTAKERFKRFFIDKVDWWFPYTDMSAEIVRHSGFDEHRITVVNNAIDTTKLSRMLEGFSDADVESIKKDLGLRGDESVGVFCGRFRPEKVSFLLDAALRIKENFEKFRLIIIGKGEEQESIRAFAEMHDWVMYMGPRYDVEQARLLRVSNLFLMPGLVGLAILDAFAAGLPLFTADCGVHSPEIEYLKTGVNGVMTKNDPASYADAVINALNNKPLLQQMAENARTAASHITIDAMADRFTDGILRALSAGEGRMP